LNGVVPLQGHLPLWPELGGSVEATRESRDVIRRFLNDAGSQA